MTRFFALAAAAALFLTACDSTETETVDLSVQTATDVEADLATRIGPMGPTGSGRYTLYSLRDGEVVLSSNEADATIRQRDSASTKWDIGLNATTIILNGGASGPGVSTGVLVSAAFENVTDALNENYVYRRDGEASCPSGAALAICTGSSNGWYSYAPFSSNPADGGYILPTAGRTLLVRLADGSGYAKVRFVSYYKGNPVASAITATSESRYYTFDYVVNTEGSTFVEAN